MTMFTPDADVDQREPWRCDVVGSFAWKTCTERWPRIVDGLARELPAHAAALHALRDEIRSGTVLTMRGADDDARFDAVHDVAGLPWTALPWYLGESWLYARIRAAVGFKHHHKDPFRARKAAEEHALVDGDNPSDPAPLDSALWRALWGNRVDLSLPSAMAHTDETAASLLVDDREQALAWLQGARRVDILLDNAGVEVFADLQLARALTDVGVEVTLWAKDVPFFVSDAMPADVEIARRRLRRPLPPDVTIRPERFLSGPGFLQTSALPAHVVTALSASDVIIAKGDCNYRRLVCDAVYDVDDDRSFDDVVAMPAPVIALRTLKAEVAIGIPPDRARAAAAVDGDWLVSGRFGVVQCAAGKR
jgi:uncharacterized protein with ATP-grasp and redox domains